MKLKLTRYYGDAQITKSKLEIVTKTGRVAFSCGARETKFKDYSTYFAGCSTFCMPTGTYRVRFDSSDSAPLALYIMHVPGHQKEFIDFSEYEKKFACRVIIGKESSENPLTSELIECKEVFWKFTSLLYDMIHMNGDIVFEIENEIVECSKEQIQEYNLYLRENTPFWDE